MGFNSAFRVLKLLKTPGTGVLNNLNDPILNVLTIILQVNSEQCVMKSNEQHSVFAHELQSALMLTVGFSEAYCEL